MPGFGASTTLLRRSRTRILHYAVLSVVLGSDTSCMLKLSAQSQKHFDISDCETSESLPSHASLSGTMDSSSFKRFVKEKFEARTEYDKNDDRHPVLAAELVQRAQLQSGWKVLDLACGTGLVSYMAVAAVGSQVSVIGVDISPGMIEQVRQSGFTRTCCSLIVLVVILSCRLRPSCKIMTTFPLLLKILRNVTIHSIHLMQYCAPLQYSM